MVLFLKQRSDEARGPERLNFRLCIITVSRPPFPLTCRLDNQALVSFCAVSKLAEKLLKGIRSQKASLGNDLINSAQRFYFHLLQAVNFPSLGSTSNRWWSVISGGDPANEWFSEAKMSKPAYPCRQNVFYMSPWPPRNSKECCVACCTILYFQVGQKF